MGRETPDSKAIYEKNGNFAVFNQLGVKLDFHDSISDEEYYGWLDEMKKNIGMSIHGAEIAEKTYARTEPRLNIGVYYDTKDYTLLKSGMVLRTTCNKKTHAFCAFKLDEDDNQVRRDHRYVFEGEAKKTIQDNPTSEESIAYVRQLLERDDIEHPGTHLKKLTGIEGKDLMPALCIEQYRHPYFVWLDGHDALRCSMDRVSTYNLRILQDERDKKTFSEIELPIYPHVEDIVVNDPRLKEMIKVLSDSLTDRFGLKIIYDSKYQRAAKILNIV